MTEQPHILEKVSVRLVKDSEIYSNTPIIEPLDAVKLIGDEMCELDREAVCIINLHTDGRPINCSIVSMGALDQAIVTPREIYKAAILSNAQSMILVHNHPGGINLTPSAEDIKLTKRMLQCADIMQIPVRDHIIVGGDNRNYFSFAEKNLLSFEKQYLTANIQDIDFKQEILIDIKKQGFVPTSRMVDNIDAINEIRRNRFEITKMKDIKEYGQMLKEEKSIYNALIKECKRQELARMNVPVPE